MIPIPIVSCSVTAAAAAARLTPPVKKQSSITQKSSTCPSNRCANSTTAPAGSSRGNTIPIRVMPADAARCQRGPALGSEDDGLVAVDEDGVGMLMILLG